MKAWPLSGSGSGIRFPEIEKTAADLIIILLVNETQLPDIRSNLINTKQKGRSVNKTHWSQNGANE